MAFVDVRMPPGWDGMQTASMIRKVDQRIEIVIITAYSDRDRLELVKEIGTPEKLLYLKKPFDVDELRQIVLSLTRKWNLERRAEQHRDSLERLLSAVRRLKTTEAESVADVLRTVLTEVLSYADVPAGFVARVEDGSVELEVVSDSMSRQDALRTVNSLDPPLGQIESIRQIHDVVVFPLRDIAGSRFVLAVNVSRVLSEEEVKLLRLLLETSSEMLMGARRREKALQSERMAALGEVAAGIIHEINNPLTQILMAGELCELNMRQLWVFLKQTMAILDTAAIPSLAREQLDYIRSMGQPEKVWNDVLANLNTVSKGVAQLVPYPTM